MGSSTSLSIPQPKDGGGFRKRLENPSHFSGQKKITPVIDQENNTLTIQKTKTLEEESLSGARNLRKSMFNLMAFNDIGRKAQAINNILS